MNISRSKGTRGNFKNYSSQKIEKKYKEDFTVLIYYFAQFHNSSPLCFILPKFVDSQTKVIIYIRMKLQACKSVVKVTLNKLFLGFFLIIQKYML